MIRRVALIALSLVVAPCESLLSQRDSGAVVRVRGVVFDSVRNRPLADAFVAVVGGAGHTQSDSRGRFQLDSVPEGLRTIVVQHPVLDTLGFSGLRSRVRIADNQEIRVATPSFATMWKRLCGERPVSDDSGFVYGVIRDVATNRPISEALVSAVWYDSVRQRSGGDAREEAAKNAAAFAKARRAKKNDPIIPFDIPVWADASPPVEQVRAIPRRLQDVSDSTGVYRVCGVPRNAVSLRVSALADTLESDSLDARADLRVFRRDLRIPLSPVAKRSILAGQLVDRSGNSVPYARVNVLGSVEARTDDSGRFVLRDVEAGTRLVEVRFIGMVPHRTVVDLTAGDSTFINIPIDRVPMLGAMNVRAAGLGRVLAAEFDSRRKLGLGVIMDSTFISRYATVENVMREVPGLVVRRGGLDITMTLPDGRGGTCVPRVYLDGLEANAGHLFDLSTKEAVAIESYVQPLTVPAAFREMGVGRKCGAVLAWTKYAFHNR